MLDRMTEESAIRARRPVLATLAGQGIAALGLLIQWMSAPDVFPGFPPGLFYVAGACAVVWFDRRAVWSPAGAVVLSLWIVVGGLAGGDLIGNLVLGNAGLTTGIIVMVLGLLMSAAAGIVAIVHNRRAGALPSPKPLSTNNPRRVAVIVTVVGLVIDAIADGAPEGLNWDGPGPVLFLILAALVAFVPGRTMPALAVVISCTFVFAAFTNPEPLERLANPGELVGFGFQVLQILGLCVAIAGGIAALAPQRQPRTA